MMQKMDGMNYAPVFQGHACKVVQPGEFCFSVIGLDHGHVYAMVNGLLEAGATLRYVVHHEASRLQEFLQRYPQAEVAASEEVVFEDAATLLVVSASRPDRRAALGLRVLAAGMHFFVDKPGMLSEQELDQVTEATRATGLKYMIYFGERVHVEGAVHAQRLIDEGKLGRILSVTILAPHRLNKETRPDWFFDPSRNGGIITDIGSHQIEQFLSYTQANTATVSHSNVANFANADHPMFQDFGDISLVADTGAVGYVRVDWFTPAGLGAWGDGRVFIVGTEGTLEIRKYLDLARETSGDQVYLVDSVGEHHQCVTGMEGFPFFGQFIRDCIDGTDTAMTQEHVLTSMAVTLQAQACAQHIATGVHA